MVNEILGFRHARNLSQQKLAELWGVAQNTISRLESRRQGLGSQEAIRISGISGLPLSAFIFKPEPMTLALPGNWVCPGCGHKPTKKPRKRAAGG